MDRPGGLASSHLDRARRLGQIAVMVVHPEAEQRLLALTPLADALAAVDALTRPVEPREVGIDSAGGCVLATNVIAPANAPAAALSLRDGWAVKSDETIDAGSYAPAILSALPRRVDAGDPLPAGADAVAPLDGVIIRDRQAEASLVVAPGEGVLPAGADVRSSALLRAANEPLRVTDQALLSALGIVRIAVREPRIRLVQGKTSAGQARDWLARVLAAEGAAVISDSAADPSQGQLNAAFHDEGSDAVLVVGGTGSGKDDASVATLAKAGRVSFHGVGLNPGETAAFGSIDARTVLLLPERFDAALAAWLVIGRHWLRKLGGQAEDERAFPAQLTRKVTSTVGMAEVVPVRCRAGKAEPLASGYLSASALAGADGWILVAPESEGHAAGATVSVRSLP